MILVLFIKAVRLASILLTLLLFALAAPGVALSQEVAFDTPPRHGDADDEPTRPGSHICSPVVTCGEVAVSVRRLREDVVVVSDDRGGWRLERSAAPGILLSVEDPFGTVVEITRDGSGRPIGLLVGDRLALEYVYLRDDERRWLRKRLYDLQSGKVVFELDRARIDAQEMPPVAGNAGSAVVEAEERIVTVVDGARYAAASPLIDGAVIRSVVIDGTAEHRLHDRVDYTDSQLMLSIGDGYGDEALVVAAPRRPNEEVAATVVTMSEPRGVHSDTVWSTIGTPAPSGTFRPTLKETLPSAVEEALSAGFPVALERLQTVPECRALFETFAVSGSGRLMSTLYARPRDLRGTGSCTRGALAYTHVGSPITHLCPSFAHLSPDEAAVVLIHEALHSAGMKESPYYKGALTSRAINELVQSGCGF